MNLLDLLAALVIYAATYWLFGPLILIDSGSRYISVVVGLHALTAIALAATGIVLGIDWAIRQLF